MRTAFKYRIYPTKSQEQELISWFGQGRFVWNYFLELTIKKYEEEKKYEFKYDLKKRLPLLKGEFPWINAPAHALQNKAFDFGRALNRYFDKQKWLWSSVGKNKREELLKRGKDLKKFGFPQFKRKDDDTTDIKIDQVQQKHISWTDKKIKIPKLGWVKWIYHRKIQGRLTSITIKRDVDHWYIVLLCEQNDIQIRTAFDTNECIGLDLGLKSFYVDSNNKEQKTLEFYRRRQDKLRNRQRKLNHRRNKNGKKKTRNTEKLRIEVARLCRKARNQRKDQHHKLSKEIANQYSVVLVEDLNIAGMIKNRKLSKSIQDQGWRQFISYLEYKLQRIGGLLHKIDRWAASTQTCSCCGHKQFMTLDQRTYICSNCDNVMGRDYNSAINIKDWGINEINTAGTAEIYACGDIFVENQAIDWFRYVSLKQEEFLHRKEAITL